jgi:hypothetical protein
MGEAIRQGTESAWSVYEEDDDSDGAPLQAPRAPRNSDPRSGPNSRTTTKQRVLARFEGIAIAAVMGLVTKEKPFVGMKRIVQHACDYEKDPGCARLRPMNKKAIKTPVDQRIFKGTKDSYGLTKRGLAHAHGEKAQSKTDLHRETASCDAPLNSPFSVQTQKKLPIERIDQIPSLKPTSV